MLKRRSRNREGAEKLGKPTIRSLQPRGELSWNDAVAAITLEPARVFGLAYRYGSLETGKIANVVIWSSDPLGTSSAGEHVLISGAGHSLAEPGARAQGRIQDTASVQ